MPQIWADASSPSTSEPRVRTGMDSTSFAPLNEHDVAGANDSHVVNEAFSMPCSFAYDEFKQDPPKTPEDAATTPTRGRLPACELQLDRVSVALDLLIATAVALGRSITPKRLA